MTLLLSNTRFPLAALLAGTCLAGPALALTPDELWEQNLGYLEATGYEVEADITRNGDDLTVDELRLTVTTSVEDEDLTMVFTLQDLTYAARGNEVELVLPAAMPMVMQGDTDEGPFRIEMTLTQEGLKQMFSGTPEDISGSYDAPSLGFTVDRVTGPDDVEMSDLLAMTMAGLTGTARILEGDGYNVSQDFTADALTYTFDVVAPEGEDGEAHGSGSFSGLTFTGMAHLPATVEGEKMDPTSLMTRGMTLDSTMTHAGGEVSIEAKGEGDTFTMSQTSAGGQLVARITPEGLHYDVSGSDIAMKLASSDLPFPIDASLAEAGFGITMPLAATDEPAPIGLRLTLRDAALPDGLWSMVDPMGKLPRDPLTVDARLSGGARLFHDLTDTEALEAMDPTEAPGELTSLTLDRLELKAGGAALQAEGHFDVDNSVKSRLNPDMPKATGTLDVTAQGVLGLIQTLGEMGLVPPDQAMMAPMMLGMFARQVSGPDDLASTLEITEDESVLVNGNPMMP